MSFAANAVRAERGEEKRPEGSLSPVKRSTDTKSSRASSPEVFRLGPMVEKQQTEGTSKPPPSRPPAGSGGSARTPSSANVAKTPSAASRLSSSEKSEARELKKMQAEEWGQIMGDKDLSVSERLAMAVRIHSGLCEAEEYQVLQKNVDLVCSEELLRPLIELSRISHSLNYIPFRLMLLFTNTTNSIQLLARLGAVPAVMHCLTRPQSSDCIRYAVEVLSRICRSRHCYKSQTLGEIGQIDALVLLNYTSAYYYDQIPQARQQVLQIMKTMLITRKGRASLLRAGALYALLDLLAQHKKGAGFFSKAEVRMMEELKRQFLYWESHSHSQHPKP